MWACAVRLSVLALYAHSGCAPAVFIPAELPLKSVDVSPCLGGLVQGIFGSMCLFWNASGFLLGSSISLVEVLRWYFIVGGMARFYLLPTTPHKQ